MGLRLRKGLQEIRKSLQSISLQNIVEGLWNVRKNPPIFLVKLRDAITKKEKEIEIPEEWLNPDAVVQSNPISTPVAVEPSIVFESPPKYRFALSVPWLFGVKRVVAFVLLVTCLVSMYWTARSFPFGLLLTGPSSFIFLDYLMKTRPKKRRLKWYILDDMEDVK